MGAKVGRFSTSRGVVICPGARDLENEGTGYATVDRRTAATPSLTDHHGERPTGLIGLPAWA